MIHSDETTVILNCKLNPRDLFYESELRRILLIVRCTMDDICGVRRHQTVQNGRKFDLFESGQAKIVAILCKPGAEKYLKVAFSPVRHNSIVLYLSEVFCDPVSFRNTDGCILILKSLSIALTGKK